jgi:thiamine monophosphate kinase
MRLDVETGIGDDCALLNIPEKKTLAISTDTLVAGNHFYLISIPPIWLTRRWRSI